MDLEQILDACSASLFALLGIWAALDHRHWFLRFVVVAPILLAALLIPAHPVVIEFGLQMMVIAAGVWLARLREHWPPRFSMETILLAMVVAAVGWAVLASADEFTFYEWVWCLKVGFCTGLIALACVELVFGHRGLWRRAWLFVMLLITSVVLFTLLDAVVQVVGYVYRGNRWQDGLASVFTWQRVKAFVDKAGAPLLLGIPVILITLVLARESRWFHTPTNDAPPPRWRLLGARVVLTTIMIAVLSPCVYVFFELMTPTPFPPIVLPEPNGYDDLVAAGRMEPMYDEMEPMYDEYDPRHQYAFADEPTLADLEAEVAAYAPMYERIELGLSREIVSPHPEPGIDMDLSLINAALDFRIELAIRRRDYTSAIADFSRLLQIVQAIHHHHGFEAVASIGIETSADWVIEDELGHFDAKQCRLAIQALLEFAHDAVPIEKRRADQHRIDENSDWETHLWRIMRDWSGEDEYWQENLYNDLLAYRRLLAARLAVQAYYRERGTVPDSLEALVPEYLPEVPRDPFGDGPLRLKRGKRTLTIYSVGMNGVDDSGARNYLVGLDDQAVTAPAYTARDYTGFLWADLGNPFFGHWIAAAKHLYDDARAHLAPRQ